MKKISTIATLLVLVLLVACAGNPLDKKYNAQTFVSDVSSLKDSTQQYLIAATALRLAYEEKDLTQYTLGQLLEEGNRYAAEQAEIEAEEAANACCDSLSQTCCDSLSQAKCELELTKETPAAVSQQ